MNLITKFIVWSWFLCIGLVAPATLPAGGAQESIIEHRKDNIGSPIISLREFNLLSSALNTSAILARVNIGTPVNVVRVWDSCDSGKWLLVDVVCQNFSQFFYRRGWVNISKN
tara:strand:- start:115 stop:453 length:339 start_codon:yes stop_codon:yes gene_type:complete